MRYIHPRWLARREEKQGEGRSLAGTAEVVIQEQEHGGGRSRSKGEEGEKEKDPSFVEELSPENLQFLLAILRLHFFAYVHHVTDQPVQKLIFKGSSTLTRSLLLLDKSSIPLPGEEEGRGEGLKLDRRPFDPIFLGKGGLVAYRPIDTNDRSRDNEALSGFVV